MAVATDKATPCRNTVQCVLLIAPYKGRKAVFPAGAPPVYQRFDSTETEEELGSLQMDTTVVGGSSEALASDIFKTVKTKLSLDCTQTNIAGKYHML